MKIEHPCGLIREDDFIGGARETALLGHIERALQSDKAVVGGGTRGRSVRYGWNYNPSDVWEGDFPAWLCELAWTIPGPCWDSVQVNECRPGQAIAPHIDSFEFGPEIAVLSLGGPSRLIMHPPNSPIRPRPLSFVIPARSLYTLSGDARYKWRHEIRPVPALRYSIVFRRKL